MYGTSARRTMDKDTDAKTEAQPDTNPGDQPETKSDPHATTDADANADADALETGTLLRCTAAAYEAKTSTPFPSHLTKLLESCQRCVEESKEISSTFTPLIHLETNKEQLVVYLQTKIDKLNQQIRLVERKYATYKKYKDGVSISIIALSTSLTLLETIKAEIGESGLSENPPVKTFFNLSPVFISSFITCAAAIMKFKKFEDKMEGISKAVEKCIFAIARIKKCQEDILFLATREEFEEVKTRYHKDIYEYYNSCNQDIEKFLKTSDYSKYLSGLNDIDIRVMILEKDKMKRERYIENDFSNYMKDLHKRQQQQDKRTIRSRCTSRCTLM